MPTPNQESLDEIFGAREIPHCATFAKFVGMNNLIASCGLSGIVLLDFGM